jgi:hypothetical protein
LTLLLLSTLYLTFENITLVELVLVEMSFGRVLIWSSFHLVEFSFGRVGIWSSCRLDELVFGRVVVWSRWYLVEFLFGGVGFVQPDLVELSFGQVVAHSLDRGEHN